MKRTALAHKTPVRRTVFKKAAPKTKKKKRSTGHAPKVWSTTMADRKFSLWIRERDGNRCIRCKTTERLTNSHYWRRGHSSTRYDQWNCITLCVFCHAEWEHLKNLDYRDFMLDWLGEELYDALELRARTFKKRSDAVLECMALLQSQVIHR